MNIFSQFVKSLYSPKDMASFRFQGIGKTILYVFFLVLITSIPSFINLGTDVTKFFTTTQTALTNETPDFYIEDGIFHADVDEPFIIEKEGMTIIFDPENEFSLSNIQSYSDVVAVQKKEIILQYQGTPQFISLADFQDVYIGKEELVSFLDSFESSIPLIVTLLIVAGYIFFSATKFIQVTILGLIGLILKNSLKRQNLRFRHTWIIAAYAVTIPSLLFAILNALRLQIPFSTWLSFGASIFIMFLIIKEVKIKKPKVE